MNPEIQALIKSLQEIAKEKQATDALCFADGGNEADHPLDYYTESKAANVLQAVFDPENQPSQYGTNLGSL